MSPACPTLRACSTPPRPAIPTRPPGSSRSSTTNCVGSPPQRPRPREARPDVAADRPGARGVPTPGRGRGRRGDGTAGGISSRPPPRRCAASWSRPARRRRAAKHGGGRAREDLDADLVPAAEPREDLLALDEALDRLAATNRQAAELVQLRYFAGLTLPDAAEALGMAPRTAGRSGPTPGPGSPRDRGAGRKILKNRGQVREGISHCPKPRGVRPWALGRESP